MRAQIIKAAKNVGFHFVEQYSVNHTGTRNKPISAIIMEKLGGSKNKNSYFYTFNVRGNLPKGVLNARLKYKNNLK